MGMSYGKQYNNFFWEGLIEYVIREVSMGMGITFGKGSINGKEGKHGKEAWEGREVGKGSNDEIRHANYEIRK